METAVLWLILVRGRTQKRRRLRVGVHEAKFIGPSVPPHLVNVPHYFVKVTNLSERDEEVTHIWFEGQPPVHILERLPARLRPDETKEFWAPSAAVAHIKNVEHWVRARLSNRKVVKSRPDRDLPVVGKVAV